MHTGRPPSNDFTEESELHRSRSRAKSIPDPPCKKAKSRNRRCYPTFWSRNARRRRRRRMVRRCGGACERSWESRPRGEVCARFCVCFLASWADDEILTRLIWTWFCSVRKRADVSLTSPMIDGEGAFIRGHPWYPMSKVIKDPTSVITQVRGKSVELELDAPYLYDSLPSLPVGS